MKQMLFIISLLTLAMSAGASASSNKVCFGSTKSDDTKGLVMSAQIDESKITLKMIKGDFYNGTYPAYNTSVRGRDGKIYLEYKGEQVDYQDVIMVDEALLEDSSSGLLQVRARGEGFFNSVFVCKDAH